MDDHEQKLNLSAPVYKNMKDTLDLSLAGGQLQFRESRRLSTGTPVPQTLSRFELGAQFSRRLPEKRTFSLRGSVGYAGDDFTKATKDTSYSLAGTYGLPGEKGYWLLMVYMANNSIFVDYLPLPGVAYLYRTPTFSGLFGLPFLNMQWTPKPDWSYSFSLFGPTLQTEAAYGHRDQEQYFAGYQFSIQSYIPSFRDEHPKDRLKLQEQKLLAGMRGPLFPQNFWELQAGRSFSRSVYVGQGFLNEDHGSANLPDQWFVQLSLKVLW